MNNISDTEKFKLPEKGKYKFDNVPLDDPRVWALFERGDTLGVFQLEKPLGQDWSKRVKPKNIEELSALIAILRPGPLECLDGDTRIARRQYWDKRSNEYRYSYCKLKDLYQEWQDFQTNPFRGSRRFNIISLDEQTKTPFVNKIKFVQKTGIKEVFNVIVKIRLNNCDYDRKKFYNIHATAGHKFLTLDGWKELKDIQTGEYICVVSHHLNKINRSDRRWCDGYKTFRDRAFSTYKYKCAFCDWNEGSLDVNHIYENRTKNNNPENLSFLCPNHHRMYSEGKISPQELIKAKETLRLPNNEYIRWVQLQRKDSLGAREVYDIAVDGPNNNYIAGDFIVHNSKMSDQYARRKNGLEEVEYFHPSLKPILESTYGCLIYQEQAMRIGVELAGFTEEEADTYIRKGIGKKLPEVIAQCKKIFLEKAEKKKVVTLEEAEEIFSWIEKGQRYSFNKSHSLSYSLTSYLTAFQKVHFPTEFYCSWLTYSDWKPSPREEIYDLVQNARLNNIQVFPPSITRQNVDFEIIEDKKIVFGLSHIRGVGSSAIESIRDSNSKLDNFVDLILATKKIKRNVTEGLIKSGACDSYNTSRTYMLKVLHVTFGRGSNKDIEQDAIFKPLTDKELRGFFSYINEGFTNALEKVILEKFCVTKRIPVIKAKIDYLNQIKDVVDTNRQKSIWEKLYLGLNLTCSAVDDIEKVDKKYITCKQAYSVLPKSQVTIYVVIDKINLRKTTEKAKVPNQEYCYLDVSDSTGAIKGVVCWPEQYEQYKKDIAEGMVVCIYGRKEKWREKEQIIVNDMTIIG